ncbi:MAG: MBL fold metallo-hydrolase [Chloroflexi bacterium]|nr:MBL fold metallo-hydrolase [Chloroflexota bacterium]
MELITPDLHRIELKGVNAYLWTGENGPSLIDTGFPWSVEQLKRDLAEADVTPGDLQRIFITHSDIDHIGGLRALKRDALQARVACHAAESAYVRGERPKPLPSGPKGWLARLIAWLLFRRYKPGVETVDELVIEGHVFPEGFTALHMPGHAPGLMALLHKKQGVLILGDALNNNKSHLTMPPAIFTPQMDAAIESLGKLRKYEFDIACFGHGPPITKDAKAAIMAFAEPLTQ